MKKLKIYLDTTIVSYLYQLDTPDKMQDTLKLWELFKSGTYKAVLSDVTLREVNNCTEPKLSILTDYLNQIEYDVIIADEEAMIYADNIVHFGILTQKSFDDCTHIAAAVVSNCDIIASWNFKHIVNHKTIQGVKTISTANGYKDILIYTPTIIVEGESEDE